MISIIIPSLNSPHIRKIVQILKKEKTRFKDMEIIVVGKDKEGLLNGEGDIRFVDTGKAVSPALSRNIGIKLSCGEVIIFLDSDCIPQDGWLGHLIRRHEEGKDVIGGAIDFKEGNFWQLSDNIIHFYNSHPCRRGGIVKDGPLPTANLCTSREALNKTGLFSEDLVTGEDFEYSMRMREKGYALNFERNARVLHLTSRATLLDVLNHSRSWAINSIYLRNRFSHFLGTPFFMKNGFLLYLFSPAIALFSTVRIFFTSKKLLKYWYTIPIIYLAKLIWSVSAAGELIQCSKKSDMSLPKK